MGPALWAHFYVKSLVKVPIPDSQWNVYIKNPKTCSGVARFWWVSKARCIHVTVRTPLRHNTVLTCTVDIVIPRQRGCMVANGWCISRLTHLSLASCLWDIGKQCRTRSDATERGVWSGPGITMPP